MAECGTTNLTGTLSISTTAENDVLTLSELEGLDWIELPDVGNIGDTGVQQNVVSYSTWGRLTLCKGKGQADAGSPTIECLDKPSAGMDAFMAAAVITNQNRYAFRIVWSDGAVEYNRGLVLGPVRNKGGNEDFRRKTFTLALEDVPTEVEASS